MKTIFLLALLGLTDAALAQRYYRFFRGVKLQQLPESAYLGNMARDFVPLAPRLFPHLENYLVAIPARETGVDEVALLSYTSEEAYLRGRATPLGKGYGDAHWTVFEQSESGSLVPEELRGPLQANRAYDLIGKKLDWSRGYTNFFIGEKKAGLSSEAFLRGLDQHVRKVRHFFRGAGLLGYVIIATPDREYAFMNWESKSHADYAMAHPAGKLVRAEAESLMKTLNWTVSERFQGRLSRNQTYTVK